MHLVRFADEVAEQCEVCRAFDKAPRIPIAGTSTASAFNEKLQIDLLFLGDIIALRIMDMFSKYSLLIPARSKNPQEVRDAFCNSWLSVFGQPKGIQLDEGGGWKNEILLDLCSERRIKLQFQGVGAHPWILERRNGLARGNFNRIREDDRFTGRQILSEVQWRLNALISAGGFSAYQMAFGSNPMDDQDGDLSFAQDASLSGQFAQQWKLRIRAQEAALKEIANS